MGRPKGSKNGTAKDAVSVRMELARDVVELADGYRRRNQLSSRTAAVEELVRKAGKRQHPPLTGNSAI